jgi:hypothetical protein
MAAGFDLKIFFTLVPKDPGAVTTADVLGFITAQRSVGDPRVIRLVDGESGLSARTIKRRLSSLSSMFVFLVARGDVDSNPVPQGLPTRRSSRRGRRGVPLVRTPRCTRPSGWCHSCDGWSSSEGAVVSVVVVFVEP